MAIIAIAVVVQVWALAREPYASVTVTVEHGDYDPLTERPSDEGSPGELAYLRYCAGCHGVQGDGNGVAAPFLDPKPRDFTRGLYKFVSRPSGNLPTDHDLMQTITHGLHPSSMPAFRLLSIRERKSLVEHLKGFLAYDEFDDAAGVERWNKLVDEGEPKVPFFQNPFILSDPDDLAGAIARGEELYHSTVKCSACHPAYISPEAIEELTGAPPRPAFREAVGKEDSWGQFILPPDFPEDGLKSVRDLEDLYRVLIAGVGGTAMPSWLALPADDIWALTLYVDSIRKGGTLAERGLLPANGN